MMQVWRPWSTGLHQHVYEQWWRREKYSRALALCVIRLFWSPWRWQSARV